MTIFAQYNIVSEKTTVGELKKKISNYENHVAHDKFMEFLNSMDDSKDLIYKHSGIKRTGLYGIICDSDYNTIYEIYM